MKKQDVYVVVDTPKKAKKLKEVLDMFGEDVYEETNKRLSKKEVSNEYPNVHLLFTGEWAGDCRKDGIPQKTKVSIKQLKQILAKEHLKDGDWILARCSHPSCDYLVKVDRIEDNMIKGYYSFASDSNNKWVKLSEGIGGFVKFKRYATPEEIALLEPKEEKKELEVGKWYKVSFTNNTTPFGLINVKSLYNDRVHFYGFDNIEEDCVYIEKDWFRKSLHYTEATPQEVESALIEEAKRRGISPNSKLIIDTTTIYNHGAVRNLITKDNCFRCKNNLLEILTESGTYTLFKKGKWATTIEQDKFAELKEAHKNGEVIEVFTKIGWIKNSNPLWKDNREYRIKTEEETTVFMRRLVKGNKCIREFPLNQQQSLIQNGWNLIQDASLIEKLNNI